MESLASSLVLLSKPGSEFFIDMSAMADRYEANDVCLVVDCVDDLEAANAKLPQSVEFAEKWYATFGISGNSTNCRLDGSF
jgi:hypothetical protein